MGLPELVGEGVEQYVEIASGLAQNRERLIVLRLTLRKKLLQSPAADGARFAVLVEAAYRGMWRQWCKEPR